MLVLFLSQQKRYKNMHTLLNSSRKKDSMNWQIGNFHIPSHKLPLSPDKLSLGLHSYIRAWKVHIFYHATTLAYHLFKTNCDFPTRFSFPVL